MIDCDSLRMVWALEWQQVETPWGGKTFAAYVGPIAITAVTGLDEWSECMVEDSAGEVISSQHCDDVIVAVTRVRDEFAGLFCLEQGRCNG